MSVQKYAPELSNVYMGLAADVKPGAGIGDKFLETDTLKLFIWTNAGAWVQIGTMTAAGAVSPIL